MPDSVCHSCENKPSNGFTLIELSIVLVIIGLIVGGVLVGHDMIKAAEIRAQVGQIEKYRTAVNVFRMKYNCLPGDCPNSTNYFTLSAPWGNGDGDGFLLDTNNLGFPYTLMIEPTQFWVHLYEAGLLPCCNQGTIATVPTFWATGKQYPQGKVNNAGIVAVTINAQNGFFLGAVNNYDTSGGCPVGLIACSAPTTGPFALTPVQAQTIDAKIDDGEASTGKVQDAWVWGGTAGLYAPAWYHAGYFCVQNTIPPAYNLSYSGVSCNLFFQI